MNYLNKIYIALVIILLAFVGRKLWQEKGTELFYYFLSDKKQKEMLVKTEKFEWLANVGADLTAPMEVVHGDFTDSKGESQWIPSGEYLGNNRWEDGGGIYVVGNEKRRIPERMSITWFSYAEDKFYTGDFELPQKKIYDLFKKDYGTYKNDNGTESENKYSTFLLGIAPKGLVTLWISGCAVIEIGTYQAHETQMNWNDFHKGDKSVLLEVYRKQMPLFVQEEIKQNKISNEYYKNRLKRYHYTIVVNNPDFKIYDYSLHFINHENYYIYNNGLDFLTDTTNTKALVSEMVLYIKDRFHHQLEVRINIGLLDGKIPYQNLEPLEARQYNNQLMNRFQTFYEHNIDVQLYIKFDDKIVKSNIKKPVYCGKVCLKSPTNEMEIPNSFVEVFDAE
ncbi:DUF2931 family protein [Flavobacterium procerum]|uniref:DUF2931 family protein n=1 Tax=Flavobacterium procerum TaxID=1455569 RepID=A0ABV6BS54_9FLAO